MIVLIDGDLIAYPCAAASEGLEREIAEFRCEDTLRRILHESGSTDYCLYLRGGGNFRYSIYPGYKANRTKPVPSHLESCREYLVRNWNGQLCEGIETDDRLGIEQTRYGTDSIIASFDKDLLQVPGWHYNFRKKERLFISPYDGLRNYYKQLIAGDGADNIPSYDGKVRNTIPKFIKALQDPLDEMTEEWDMWEYCKEVYELSPSLPTIPSMHINAQLLYILREEGVHWQEPVNPNTNQDLNQEQPE